MEPDSCGAPDNLAHLLIPAQHGPYLRMRGGLQPDLLSDAGWWQTPLWQYVVFAVVIYSRAAAERLAVPVEEVARRIATQDGLELPA